MSLRSCTVTWAVAVLPTGVGARAQQESLLTFGVTGSEGRSGYSSVMRQVAVQKLLLDIANAPRTPEFLDAALKGMGVQRQDLERLGLVQRRDGEYIISFALFTAQDAKKVRATAERATHSLVDAFVTRRPEIDALLQRYDADGIDREAIAYIVLGCFSLDWDGLELTAERGYRSVPEITVSGGKFIPWAEEKTDLSLKGIYWGSHNRCEQEFCLTSFGDHFSLPRWAFPDLGWLWRLPIRAARDLSEPLNPEVESALGQAVGSMLRQVGRIMFALRDRQRTLAELAGVVGMGADQTKLLLNLLGELEYVSRLGHRYRSLVPVLSERDAPLVQGLRRIGWEVMEAWLSANYMDVKAQLSDLTAVRYGVPYAAVFTQVWHYLFGTANAKLVKAGVFADPYAPGRRHKGFIPVVFHRSLRDLR